MLEEKTTVTTAGGLLEGEALLRLADWLPMHVDGWKASSPLSATKLTGGSSASIFLIKTQSWCAVLRAPQQPPRPDSLRALAREARVLKALGSSQVPHPHLIAYCEDTTVIGVPFIIMELVDGWVGADEIPAGLVSANVERSLAFSLIDSLASLHALNFAEIGLADFGRPEGFLQRQVDQWLRLFASHSVDPAKPSRRIADVPVIADWLQKNIPAKSRTALIHCDASFSNVIFKRDTPEVAALIDWEISTIGDPLLDLGRAIYPFPDARGLPGVSMMRNHTGGPTRQELAMHYAERTGTCVANIDFYMVLAMFKLAALIEPNYARDLMGLDPSGFSGRVANFVLELIQGARALIDLETNEKDRSHHD